MKTDHHQRLQIHSNTAMLLDRLMMPHPRLRISGLTENPSGDNGM
ncbi:hypothetical protein [Alcanivorax sp.]